MVAIRANQILKTLFHITQVNSTSVLTFKRYNFKSFFSTMTTRQKKIGTHDGVFHCDEVLACFLLRRLPEYTYSEIIRTRDSNILDTCDIVVDVGGVYDPKTHRYDHHQREFTHTMRSLDPNKPWDVKLSSAGLIYFHFGERIFEAILGSPQDPKMMKCMFNYIYEKFIREIDGIDNGVPMYDGEPKYNICSGISSRVGNLNPSWNNEEPYDSQKLFHMAMDLVGKEFIEHIHYFTKSWWPAQDIVREAVVNRALVHESEEIIELKKCCPWKEHLVLIENELNLSGLIKFVVFKNNSWRVQGVPIAPNSFICRQFLNEKWRGLRDEELERVSGISDSIFVHSTGFIGGHKSRDGAVEMAVKSLQSSNCEINKVASEE